MKQAAKLRIGIVGVGAMGRNHLRVLQSFSDVVVSYFIDPEPGVKELADKVGAAYSSELDVAALKQAADAVIVAAPTAFHASLAEQLISARLPTLVEKPLAASYRDAHALAGLADKNDTLLAVGHVERHNPGVRAARELLASGAMGQIANIAARRLGLAPPAPIDSNNVVVDIAVHDLDIIRWLFEREPLGLTARAGRAWALGSYDYVDILMDFGGPTGHVQANWLTPVRVRTLSLTGTHAYAELDYIKQRLVLYRHHRSPAGASYKELRALSQSIVPEEMPVATAEPLMLELRNFVDSLRGLADPLCSAAEGAAAVRLAEAALESCARPLQADYVLPIG